MHTRAKCFMGWLLLAAATGAAPDARAEVVRRTYRDGLGGYAGTRGAGISTIGQADYNGHNGTTFTDAVDWCIGDLPRSGYQESVLFRFEALDLPAGARVVAASLTLQLETWDDGQRVLAHYLAVPWSHTAGPNGAGLGWLRRDTGLAWATAGARGEGSDVLAGREVVFDAIPMGGHHARTAALDTAIVQRWVDERAAANHGVILRVDRIDHHTSVVPHGSARTELRPTLEIDYEVGGVVADGGSAPDAGPEPDAGSATTTDAGTATTTDAGTATTTDAGAASATDADADADAGPAPRPFVGRGPGGGCAAAAAVDVDGSLGVFLGLLWIAARFSRRRGRAR